MFLNIFNTVKAHIKGGKKYPKIDGLVTFKKTKNGVLLTSKINNLPPLIENNGYAYMSVLTNKFKIENIIGKVIIIHDPSDDFTTQPSGNSGTKIACGKIER